jgi:uridine kinase
MNFADLASQLLGRRKDGRAFIIAIDGHGGTGKSTFSKWLCSELEKAGESVSIISTDEFPLRSAVKSLKDYPEVKTAYAIDFNRLKIEVLEPLKSGKEFSYKSCDWWDAKKDFLKTLEGDGFVIIEGCYSLRDELRGFYDYKIFIDVALRQAQSQASARDISNGGNDVIAPLLWQEIYYPHEVQYMKCNT